MLKTINKTVSHFIEKHKIDKKLGNLYYITIYFTDKTNITFGSKTPIKYIQTLKN